MKSGHPSNSPDFTDIAGDHRSSGKRKSPILLTGTPGQRDNFRLAYQTIPTGDRWAAPRHHHDFEQIRWVLSGDLTIAKDTMIPPGSVGYFPESVFYGPQLRGDNLEMVLLQYGGPSGFGFDSPEQMGAAQKEMEAAGGVFHDGIYTWIDADGKRHNQDSAEAVHEHIRSHKMIYAPKRYDDLLIIDPEAFAWTTDPAEPGVQRKKLATFTEREVKLGVVSLDPGATIRLGTEPAIELVFVREGAVSAGGVRHEKYSALSTDADENPQTIRSEGETTLFYVKLPTFDAAATAIAA
jgi:hypothetical protein